ncbi:uncharacterized protein EAE97_001660 [Botrytis byssoidea]|uniref:Uncharacterized protein n=1 Tax=Botrytis byssoidea TaxID=139641 RepID=A0A9P5ISA0_9HELO|nr:uncharacterized protein EAE97_001660 [Botrytis byssoidea]KAF7952163.1 hypothetical protein EAE97_001660 [Botrytis byssoidea]
MQERYWLRGRRRWMDWDDDAGIIGREERGGEGRGNELPYKRTVFFDSSQGQGQGRKEVRRGALLRHMVGPKEEEEEEEEEEEAAEDYNG